MKKIVFFLTLMLAVTVTATAQDKKPTAQESAKIDALKLTQLLKLDATQNENFYHLFEMKYTTLEDKTLSDERKKILSSVMEGKLRGSLTPEQMTALEAQKEFYQKLIN